MNDTVRLVRCRRQGPVLVGASGQCDSRSERLYGTFQVEGAKGQWDWLIDTGSPMTVFPKFIWTQFGDYVEWLHTEGVSLPDWLTKVRGVAGGQVSCDVGRVRVILRDLDSRAIGPVPMLAKFVRDEGPLREALFGLTGGVLAGRNLHIEYDGHGNAWLRLV